MVEKTIVYKRQHEVPKSFLKFPFQPQITFFSYQPSILTTKPRCLQDHGFIGWIHMYRLCRFCKMPEKIRLIFLVQNLLQILRYNSKMSQKDDKRDFRLLRNQHGRRKYQLVLAIEKSVGHCSRKLWQSGNIVPSNDTNNFQRSDWSFQTISEGRWPCWPSLLKDLCDSAGVQCGKIREVICSSPIVLQRRRRTKSFNTLSKLNITLKNLSIYLMEKLCIW